MAREIPSAPRVHTTTYDNFKGVDLTNDATNIWRRRSPTGTNMLPDASGRPFKRHGWEILLSNESICFALGGYDFEESDVDETTFNINKSRYFTESGGVYTQCTFSDSFDENETYYIRVVNKEVNILKCSYFELGGVDHIAVFTDDGVLFYNGDSNSSVNWVTGITAINKDIDCYSSYDRCFFFEGGGTSAFYIYGNYKVWVYDSTFTLRDATDEAYIPTVIITADAEGVGTFNEGYNLLRNMASVQYQTHDLFTYWGTKGLNFEVKDAFKTAHTKGSPTCYKWKYNGSSWVWALTGETSQTFDSTNIVPKSPKVDDEIVVLHGYGLMLPNNVNVDQYQSVTVTASVVMPLDTDVPVTTLPPLTTGNCLLRQDTVKRDNRQAWIEFYPNDFTQTAADFDMQDAFKVTFPSSEISETQITNEVSAGTATLDGGDA